MGQEIVSKHFSEDDFAHFEHLLRNETDLLRSWFAGKTFSDAPLTAGFELEAWLVNAHMSAEPVNEEFLNIVQDPLVVHELAKFNVEINSIPQILKGNVFSRMHTSLSQTREKCNVAARSLGTELITIGSLPTLKNEQLILQNISPRQRYLALNEQVMNFRSGKPIRLNIYGREHCYCKHHDVMLEAASTSLQIHLQVPLDKAVRFFNASKVVSAPMIAICANAPYLFGFDLWDETRIPVFEQSVSLPGHNGRLKPERVTFGERYALETLMECFDANLSKYPVLLPHVVDAKEEELQHLRLHNGTIWRWNRPLIGFTGGKPHLRIEHRVTSAPTSDVDCIANMAFYFGLMVALVDMPQPPESLLEFSHAERNMYAAARLGLMADVWWLKKTSVPMYVVILDDLLPLAKTGLESLGIDDTDIEYYLGIIEDRVTNRQNGASWQRNFVKLYGKDMQTMTRIYASQQHEDLPVHEWKF